jgi:hypothetical protein
VQGLLSSQIGSSSSFVMLWDSLMVVFSSADSFFISDSTGDGGCTKSVLLLSPIKGVLMQPDEPHWSVVLAFPSSQLTGS